MFKLTVEQILASVEALNSDEKAELEQRLPRVLGKPTSASTPSSGQSQSQSFGNVNVSGSNNAADLSQRQAGRDLSSHQQTIHKPSQAADLEEALSLLAEIKQRISTSAEINPLIKAGVESQVQQAEEEIQKPEPNRDLVSHTLSTLKKGLEGVQTLAEPTMKVAALVARVWGIPVP
jgi:hypothetical protein